MADAPPITARGPAATTGTGRRVRHVGRAVAVGGAAFVFVALWARLGPLPPGLLDPPATPSTVVVDRHGVPLYEALSAEATRAIALAPEALPPGLVAATIAAEDRRFFRHVGVDPIAVVRALGTNLAEGRIVEGASTISQQVAKLLLNRQHPERRRGLAAKSHEALVALRLEHRFSKRELLALYLNVAAYGNQFTGAERASQSYFGVPAAMLTPAQAAYLAALPQRPSAFNPYRDPTPAAARQRVVLRRMRAAGTLSADDLAHALAERLTFVPTPAPFTAPHFVEMVLAAAGEARPARIATTLDRALQADVAGIIARQRADLRVHGAFNVAVVVLENATGEWVAWEGSGDYADAAHGGTINGPLTLRQPGSALKPFTYALAFEGGTSPATVLADVPTSFPTAEDGIVYHPRNYDGRFRGPLLARHALAGSVNVPAVALAAEVGLPNVLRFLRRAGLTTFDKTAAHYGLGLTLGNAEVRLDELTAAYAAFARGGEWLPPTFVRRAPEALPETTRIVSDRTAFWITDILADPESREFVFGRGGSLELPFPVAVKTGTSQAYHDNWTIGYSRHATVGVWVGNFDRRPLRQSSGVTGAGPIFHAVMLAAEERLAGAVAVMADGAIVPPPSNAVEREVCADSGDTANGWCPLKRREWVAVEVPDVACSWHHLSDEGLQTFLPARFDTWARAHGVRVSGMTAPAADAVRASGGGQRSARPRREVPAAFGIVSPPDGATYLIDPTLRREYQTLPLRVVAAGARRIEWRVGGRVIGTAAAAATLDWPLVPGTHRLEATDDRGRTAGATVTVR